MSTSATHTSAHKKSGFTLVELIVSLGLFTVVMTISLGSLLVVIDANKQAKAIKLVVNNLNLALEGMSRELRVSQSIDRQDCRRGSSRIDFVSYKGERSFFELGSHREANSIVRKQGSNSELRLTGPDVVIDNLRFHVCNVGTGDQLQPSVLILLQGHSGAGDEQVDFNIQTTVSPRRFEL